MDDPSGSAPRSGRARRRTAVPEIEASQGPGGERIEVLRFDRDHERVGLGPHRHLDLELLYVERGTGVDRLGTRVLEVGPGDVLLVTPGVEHDASGLGDAVGWSVEFDPVSVGLADARRAAATTPLSRLWWSTPLLAPFLRAERHADAARLSVPEHEQRLWVEHLRIMDDECRTRREGYSTMLAAYLQIVLVALGRLAAGQHPLLDDAADPALARVFGVIEQRFREPLTTSDVAAAVGVTPGYLTTVVRERTGRTVGDWITERRMAAARDLLTSTELSAEQVAQRVGYDDPRYFTRRFRRAHGLPPGSWRRRARR